MTKHFSLKEVFSVGASKALQHAWFIFLTMVIVWLLCGATQGNPLVGVIVYPMILLSIASISLLMVREHHFTFADLYSALLSPKKVLKFFALFALYLLPIAVVLFFFSVAVAGGMTGSAAILRSGLFIAVVATIPVMYLLVRFIFFPYIVLENENADVGDLIKMTNRLSDKHFFQVLAFVISAILLNCIGVLLLGVGFLVTLPITILALSQTYNKLKHHMM